MLAAIRDGNSITVKDSNIELVYFGSEGNNLIKRGYGIVNGIRFNGDGYRHYWKKIGRGGIKNKEQVMQMIKQADSFLFSKGFDFVK